MKLFLDTANMAQVKEIASWGILDGVTTNPSLVAKEEGADFKATVTEMCGLVDEVSAQITATEFEEMKSQADEYSSWHKNVVVKVPMTVEGLKTLNYCSSKGIHTNTTLVFSVPQAIMAAKSGATMISPFVGRLDDLGMDGMDFIADIMQAWSHYKFDTQVLVASIRNLEHVVRAATLGAHICTIPYKVFQELPQHDLTDKGLKKFMEDWESVQNR
ncbi:MAG: transaldolase family protein [Candidatus Peribacter sp.]|jgi:transaldolase|nr:transaldolase family protein [Candidatus Peribacter sp.]MBT4393538.1 transaldolase family protein [Candidatus Peribacter sp.]MBT4601245.1 transaldolase family protein [Candidatus Peribacter sp.]MBT5149294.1 transaldolase family protein [Candidatus Peribacter sp.]MBT5637118.1 transaldolase family protein [Candidatus Peribacter sp.]